MDQEVNKFGIATSWDYSGPMPNFGEVYQVELAYESPTLSLLLMLMVAANLSKTAVHGCSRCQEMHERTTTKDLKYWKPAEY